MTTTTVRAALGREVDVRALLRRDVPRAARVVAWAWGLACLWAVLFRAARVHPIGSDSHAYWMAWRGPIYTTGPATPDAFLYSPAFAQIVRPLAMLPWPAFAAAFAVIDLLILAWLVRPVRWVWAVPLLLAGLPEVEVGNIVIPLAAACVLGFRYPGAWALSALTKVAPTVMPVWWLVRREWRPLAAWAAITAALLTASAAIAPEPWLQWASRVVAWSTESGTPLGPAHPLPLTYRAPVGLVLLIVGARKGWRWTVPVAALLCTPVLWLGSFVWLAAIPRLRASRSPQSRSPA